MKNNKWFILVIGVLSLALTSDEFTPYQQQQIRKTVQQYCDAIYNHTHRSSVNKDQFFSSMKLLDQYDNDNLMVYDDIGIANDNTSNDASFKTYQSALRNRKYAVKYVSSIDKAPIDGISNPKIQNSGSQDYAQILVKKSVTKDGVTKYFQDIFMVDPKSFKIKFITKPVSKQYSPRNSAIQMWQKGLAYYKTKDYKNAYKWFEKSAKFNFAPSQSAVGVLHIRGRGCKRSFKTGISWFRKSARQGDEYAQDLLLHFDDY